DVAALGAERDLYGVSQHVDAAKNRLPRLFSMNNLLCHVSISLEFEILKNRANRSIRSRMIFTAEEPARSLLAGSHRLALGGAGDNSQNFFFAHDDEFFAIQLDLCAGILAEQNAVAFLHIQRADLPFFADFALAHRNDLALLRLVLGGIGDNDSTASGLTLFHAPDQDAVMQRSKLSSHL